MLNITGEMHHLLKVSSWLVQCSQVHIHRCMTYRLARVHILTHKLYLPVYCQCCFPSCFLSTTISTFKISPIKRNHSVLFYLEKFLFVLYSSELSADDCWCCVWVTAGAKVSLFVRSAVPFQGSGYAGSEHVIGFDRNSARYNPRIQEKTHTFCPRKRA